MRLLACLIVAPQRGYDEPAILSYAISSFCPTSADGLQLSRQQWGGQPGKLASAQSPVPLTDQCTRDDAIRWCAGTGCRTHSPFGLAASWACSPARFREMIVPTSCLVHRMRTLPAH